MLGDLWIKDYLASGVSSNHYILQTQTEHGGFVCFSCQYCASPGSPTPAQYPTVTELLQQKTSVLLHHISNCVSDLIIGA